MTTLESLQAKIQKLQAQAEALAAKKSSAVIEKIKSLMAEHGLTAADIDAHAGGKKRGRKPGAKAARTAARGTGKTKGKLPPKYLNPKTGETWSGHARPPAWIANVKDRTKFLIADATQATAAAPKGIAGEAKAAGNKTSKGASRTKAVGNYVRGPQPALYRDPKTGATWSGRARAPAWIANAKDRSKFLIDGAAAAGEKSVVKKAAAKKAPPAKKVVAKKSASGKLPAKKVSAKKSSAKAAPQKGVTAAAPVATVESGAELTT
ncbi:H-NS family nucleoid-associated regulatory protein [Paraburkholderia phenoliruptrix]|uniref:H-NS family nucleoid-associated regulatory protein n=1 Tax=Paraburkholderia phenoliruptrix TaxID=252970 RepID=UPI002869D6D3|nr:H-NS family nucleoid-associated regulatory protein [Paraburkholderia phenoliruptrix]WMY11291.1 H-NS family nucleoid-associated regulatory protein [Paraburkholderia phenoliruptrix]